MKREISMTRMEEVLRVYCDICGEKITHCTKISTGLDKPNQHWVVCSSTNFYIPDIEGGLDCEQLAKIFTKYPELCHGDYLKRLRKSHET